MLHVLKVRTPRDRPQEWIYFQSKNDTIPRQQGAITKATLERDIHDALDLVSKRVGSAEWLEKILVPYLWKTLFFRPLVLLRQFLTGLG
ncbi:uncharacterized protein Dana_GF27895 [Drosophila ananassae]|uniref:Uncharacterized protein n=1 Tax=Drosophila ananassae TaxID=7217 RepID=A0A0P8Y4P6_DROAN|nr:uncharacterized protein Dana_GF27895 [Drosophila ananassae]